MYFNKIILSIIILLISFNSKSQSLEELNKEVIELYKLGDYQNAIPLLNKAFDIEKDSLLLFYKGIAYIGNGESLKAIPVFESLQTSTTLPIDTVEWFLALAYFETNQKEKATILLKNVANTEGGKYKAKANELIEKMNLK